MKFIFVLNLIFLFSCVSYRVQNKTQYNYVGEIEVTNLSKVDFQKLLYTLNNNLEKNIKVGSEQPVVDSLNKNCIYRFEIESDNTVDIIRIIKHCEYYINKEADFKRYFKVYIINNGGGKQLIYQFSKKEKINLFNKKRKVLNVNYEYIIK